MSKYYRGRRTKASSFYHPGEPFRLSRTKIDDFINCPRCFYIDRRLGVARPPGFPFTLNSSVDAQFKLHMDRHRRYHTVPAWMLSIPGEWRPASHPDLGTWQNTRKGVERDLAGLTIAGGIDDLWQSGPFYAPADYKVTSKGEVVEELGTESYHDGYRRQMDIYTWLLEDKLAMSGESFFVYCTAPWGGEPQVVPSLSFEVRVIPYEVDLSWVEFTILEAKACLDADEIPEPGEDCDYCLYRSEVEDVTR